MRKSDFHSDAEYARALAETEDAAFAKYQHQVEADQAVATRVAAELNDEEYARKLECDLYKEEEKRSDCMVEYQYSSNYHLIDMVRADEQYARKVAEEWNHENDISVHEFQNTHMMLETDGEAGLYIAEEKLPVRAQLLEDEKLAKDMDAAYRMRDTATKQQIDMNVLHNHQSATIPLCEYSLSDSQKQFFRSYGFVVVKSVIPIDNVKHARRAAESMIAQDIKNTKTNMGVFGSLPEGQRPNWADCREPALRDLFRVPTNQALCESVVGPYSFEHHIGVGSFTFAPRFKDWAQNPGPVQAHDDDILVTTSPPYDISNLPRNMSPWQQQFLLHASEFGVQLAPCANGNWHVDGWDVMSIASFDIIWGTYLTPLPRSNMGNLIVYPGTHHVIQKLLIDKGAQNSIWFDVRKGQTQSKALPSLELPGIADGKPYEVCVEPGDVVIAHPFLAHGIGHNKTNAPRLAVYCRLHSNNHETHRRNMLHGDQYASGTWIGDIFSLQPGV